jgi:ankyrin repeat protein
MEDTAKAKDALKQMAEYQDMLKKMMENMKPLDRIRTAIRSGDMKEVKEAAKGVDLQVYAGELATLSIFYQQPKLVEFFFKSGADIRNPPDSITQSQLQGSDKEEEMLKKYRRTPFLLQAVCVGDIDCVRVVEGFQGSFTEHGHIGFSPKKKNAISNHAIAAAAYYGSQNLLKYLLQKKRLMNIDLKTVEKTDYLQKGAYVPEFKDFTALMLATAAGKVECMKMLIAAGANAAEIDHQGNNLALIAVSYGQVAALKFVELELNKQVDLLRRNNKGETCMTLAEEKKNQEII